MQDWSHVLIRFDRAQLITIVDSLCSIWPFHCIVFGIPFTMAGQNDEQIALDRHRPLMD